MYYRSTRSSRLLRSEFPRRGKLELYGVFAFILLGSLQTMEARQWKEQVTGTGKGLHTVYFVSPQRGWAAGDSGIIIRTTNGGDTWTTQNDTGPGWFASTFFVDSSTGCVVGTGGKIWSTTDGGETWFNQTRVDHCPLWDVQFTSREVGWAVGGYEKGSGVYGVILKTTDAGISWNSIIDTSAGGFQGVSFVNDNEGWVVGGKDLYENLSPPLVLHTSDGGTTWQQQPIPYNPNQGPLYRVHFVDNKTGWAGGSFLGGAVLKTTNGGNNWGWIPYQATNPGIVDLWTVDSSNVWVLDAQSANHTTDGGLTFSRSDPELGWEFLGIFFIDSRNGWICGAYGKMWRYHDSTTNATKSIDVRKGFSLLQNYPNPFNPSTTIMYSIPFSGSVRLEIFDAMGKELVAFDRFELAGERKFRLDWSGYATGVYLYRLQFNGRKLVRKMILLH